MAELGEFLRSRRGALHPQDVGLNAESRRRRVAGLRREELALLAGVSLAYYTRLEQGLSRNASDSVLDALADALRLDDDERTHLHSLARPQRRTARPTTAEFARPGVRMMVDALENSPAFVLGRNLDLLAWNRMAYTLFAGHLDFESVDRPVDRPNLARLVFLDPHMLDLYADWEEKTGETVAYLRMAAGRYPDDPGLNGLIGELTVKSAHFASLWSSHPVSDCSFGVRNYQHPIVGDITLAEEVLQLADPGQRLVVYNAEPGSPSAEAMQLLARLSAPSAASTPRTPSAPRQSD
ncbi:helix-turn-helix transcriptional regulator [Streptomyces sp. NPDC088725]|uniref:helix-turn-helix transcriptional regulator n=1 Tax=Streptomyces sp. NPDC088725 TaxID=3365873 RepID=UPI00380850B0